MACRCTCVSRMPAMHMVRSITCRVTDTYPYPSRPSRLARVGGLVLGGCRGSWRLAASEGEASPKYQKGKAKGGNKTAQAQQSDAAASQALSLAGGAAGGGGEGGQASGSGKKKSSAAQSSCAPPALLKAVLQVQQQMRAVNSMLLTMYLVSGSLDYVSAGLSAGRTYAAEVERRGRHKHELGPPYPHIAAASIERMSQHPNSHPGLKAAMEDINKMSVHEVPLLIAHFQLKKITKGPDGGEGDDEAMGGQETSRCRLHMNFSAVAPLEILGQVPGGPKLHSLVTKSIAQIGGAESNAGPAPRERQERDVERLLRGGNV